MTENRTSLERSGTPDPEQQGFSRFVSLQFASFLEPPLDSF
jgi:hypothetical protein